MTGSAALISILNPMTRMSAGLRTLICRCAFYHPQSSPSRIVRGSRRRSSAFRKKRSCRDVVSDPRDESALYWDEKGRTRVQWVGVLNQHLRSRLGAYADAQIREGSPLMLARYG